LELVGKRDSKWVRDLLDLVGLPDRADALPSTLSGGELGRAALAVAIAADSPLLLADEPTAEVDVDTERRILELLEARRAKGGSALIATHSLALSAAASRVLRISGGLVSKAATPAQLVPVLTARDNEDDAKNRQPDQRNEDRLLISFRSVSRIYKIGDSEVHAVVGASCRVMEGDRIAIMGPSGSGKSTLLNVIADLPSLLPALTVLENVRLALEIAGKDPSEAMAPREALERLSLLDLAEKLPDELSGGQMQRVACARALVTRPRVILADEPTGQLDQMTGQKLLDALFAAVKESGAALIVATHDGVVARRLDRPWRMNAGVLEGDMQEGKTA
jgi:ABC-type lipoprotein export system ATPase subunit